MSMQKTIATVVAQKGIITGEMAGFLALLASSSSQFLDGLAKTLSTSMGWG